MTPNVSRRNWKFSLPQCFAVVCSAVVLSMAFSAVSGVHAQISEQPEVTTTTTPYAEFQFGTLTATTNTVNVTMLPVVLSNGSVVYENVTIPITVTENSSGAVTLSAGIIATVPFPVQSASNFKAGNYVGPDGGTAQLLTLAGPGVTAGGATEWSISTTAGATGCTNPTTASFYVGPFSSNPLYARLKRAGITSTAYSYGVMGAQTCTPPGGYSFWYTGAIIGISQTGNALTITSFTDEGTDQATPGAQITYTY